MTRPRPPCSTTSRHGRDLGDNVYENGTAAEFTNCYNPSWGATRRAPGRSSATTSTAPPTRRGYFNYFGAAAGDPGARATTATTTAPGTSSCSTACAPTSAAAARARPRSTGCAPTWPPTPTALHARPMAPPALQLRGRARQPSPRAALLAGALRRQRRPDPDRPRPHLRALRAADPNRRPRQRAGHPPVRRRHRRPEPLRLRQPQPNSEVRNGDTYGVIKLTLRPPATTGSSCPRPARPSPTAARRSVTEALPVALVGPALRVGEFARRLI